MSEVLYSFTAAPARAPEIRQGAGSIELRVTELPTPEVAANQEQSAIELRFTKMPVVGEIAWALMEVWPDREELLAGYFRKTLEEAWGEARVAYDQALAVRKLPRRGFCWGVVDLWATITRVYGRTEQSMNEHFLGGGSGASSPREAFEAGLPLFRQSYAIRKAG